MRLRGMTISAGPIPNTCLLCQLESRPMAAASPAHWALVEQLYYEGKLTIKQIAETCGVPVQSIYLRAKKLKWPPVKERKPAPASNERAMLRRIINMKLAALEKRMENPETTTPADNERDARAFASLLTSVGKLNDTEAAERDATLAEFSTKQTADAAAPSYGDADVEQWRHELARRIASLGARWQQ
jgi:AcrR family transcriptional regulator